MTAKTQSVCKHCQQKESAHSAGMCPVAVHMMFEPVAEPASTGEPPPTTCKFCRAEIYLDLGMWVIPALLKGHGAPYCHDSPDHSHHPSVARPSGPSAPQVEPHVICGNCRKTLKWFPSEPHMNHENNDIHCYPGSEETVTSVYVTPAPQTSAEPRKQCGCAHGDSDPYCPDPLCPNYIAAYHVKPSASQPVSGDAPKVEEIASLTAELIKLLDGPPSLCNYCGHSFPKGPIIYGGQNHCPLSPNSFHGFTVTIGGPDNRPHIISDFLRSHGVGSPLYFPPASQTPESIEAEELLAQYDEEYHDYLDGRPHQWQAWRDKVLRRLATPASTARTDGETK